MSNTMGISRLALIAMLATGPAAVYAQDTTATPPAEDSTDMEPATEGTMDDTTTETVPVEIEGTTETGETAEMEEPAQPVEGQIVMQGENTALASDLMGSPVHSMDGESIGDISDMIVNLDGTVEGVVIGVGGFLGLGEKAVAIEMGQLEVMTDENGETRLQTAATREDLEAAPEFVSMEDQEAAANQPAADTMGTTGTGGMAPADSTGMAPAGDAGMAPAGDAATEETTEPAGN
ncbi:PRC-barrel domain-containing protein [uncultured Jannaschia sp.]|uniref:PRC-barrel domain-containing protein n=1 Tax=uncultured Jannaschia sp. TaxID=293347 RepID=UPI00261B5E53|nr:PRC-barrel domain-containing protein [uncultured Jannaschia sp.]